jgi:phage shock protein PspC (stress-responsive transcriptional regulator)
MKKIININFHSRVIPIEETAYDILRKYVESLKKHFASEEGGDEIVNDIENRFAELFSDRLKKGATCITDADVNEIISSMGRPEDFDQDENTGTNGNAGTHTSSASAEESAGDEPRRLYRSENDKMLGGVCGGLAAYLRIDPSVMRIIYAVLILASFGTALLVYAILWIALPPKSIATNIKKRLFRDPDHRVIGGVASGLAAYFNIEIWIPRVIFCLPLIAGTLASIFRHAWSDFEGPVFFTGGFGGTLFITYIILWIVLPEAMTASEKLEMRGEKIDLGSIKNTIKSDLEGFRQKATVVGAEMKQKAEQFGGTVRDKSGNIRKEFSNVNIPRQGIGHAIGVLFKAFFLFISVIITFAIVVALIGVTFTGAGVLPLKNYFFQGFWQNIMVWGALVLFLLLPVIAMLTWLIRRIIGARSRNNYLGYTFGSLWTIGLICFIFTLASISRKFTARNGVSNEINITAPVNGRLIVKMADAKPEFYESDWVGDNWRHNGPFFDISYDSVVMSTVRIDVLKSDDSAWHMNLQKVSRGNTTAEALKTAEEINFDVVQNDSLLTLARGFSITPKQQFHNQQVLVLIKVPVGKKVYMATNLDEYHWFTINRNWKRKNGLDVEWDVSGDHESSWDSGVEYIMTEHGLERSGKIIQDHDADENGDQNKPSVSDSSRKKNDNPNGDYRYHKPKPAKSAAALTPDHIIPEEEGKTGSNVALLLLTRLS